jgi:hypothetical protein
MGVAAELDGQEVEGRVEPDDELAPLPLDGLGDAIAEEGDGGGSLGAGVPHR